MSLLPWWWGWLLLVLYVLIGRGFYRAQRKAVVYGAAVPWWQRPVLVGACWLPLCLCMPFYLLYLIIRGEVKLF